MIADNKLTMFTSGINVIHNHVCISNKPNGQDATAAHTTNPILNANTQSLSKYVLMYLGGGIVGAGFHLNEPGNYITFFGGEYA